ncbi:MAG TPA: hypothetical protein PLV25_03975 [Opitutales bacterium]|nr:hypothetical protein [Opitutales bacterium]
MDNTQTYAHARSSRIPTTIPVGVLYCRAAGLGLGFFLLAWGPVCLARWGTPSLGLGWAQCFMTWILAAWLLIPWSNSLSSKAWWTLWGLAAFSVMVFSVFQIGDVVYQHVALSALGLKLKPPVFHGMLIFLALLQLPTFIFIRYPQSLD